MRQEFPTQSLRRVFMSSIGAWWTYGTFLIVEGKLQNQENVVSVKVDIIRSLEMSTIDVRSHDFH
jgi:hypothetical protein